MDKDQRTGLKVLQLISEISRRPFAGIGKPEPPKGEPSGWWSRRITDEHCLVYTVDRSGQDPFLIAA